jgi:hypothetical protein
MRCSDLCGVEKHCGREEIGCMRNVHLGGELRAAKPQDQQS